MYNFFVNEQNLTDGAYRIDGENFNHIANVLRMQVGEQILVSCLGKSTLCEISEVFADYLTATVLQYDYNDTELPVKVSLIQGLPKADKLEFIIQKAVELGVSEILPVETARSVVKIEDKKKAQKTQRWQAIAESGAKQSKRNLVPTVHVPQTFKQAFANLGGFDLLLIPYENKNGMADTVAVLSELKNGQSVGVFIGPEGGFDQTEIDALKTLPNSRVISLGKRILRTETASITALSMIMLWAESKL